jgi:hypothetical protein
VRIAGLQLLPAVNDPFLVGAHLRHDFGPGTRRRAIELKQLLDNFFVLPGQHGG